MGIKCHAMKSHDIIFIIVTDVHIACWKTAGHNTYIYIHVHVHTCVYRKHRKCSIGRTIKLDIFPHLSDDDCSIEFYK